MKIIKEITETISKTVDIICNKCGESCIPEHCRDGNHGPGSFYGLIEASFTSGYCSPTLPDGNSYSFSICETCMAEIFKTFKIAPEEQEALF